MRWLLLVSVTVVLALLPGSGAVFAAFFPRHGRILPVWFWVLWLLISLWVTLYAPVMVDRLTAPEAGSHRCVLYARWGTVLGLINLAWSVAEILWLG